MERLGESCNLSTMGKEFIFAGMMSVNRISLWECLREIFEEVYMGLIFQAHSPHTVYRMIIELHYSAGRARPSIVTILVIFISYKMAVQA